MFTALIILHVLVAFIMVDVILLQSGKGAEIGAAFGPARPSSARVAPTRSWAS